jgi:hypothetical protein
MKGTQEERDEFGVTYVNKDKSGSEKHVCNGDKFSI